MTTQPNHANISRDVQWMLSGCIERGGSLQAFPLCAFPFRVGRHRECDLTLSSPLVSTQHAEFLAGGKGLFVRDGDSTNGTFVNGIRLTGECPVGTGDRVQFADTEFVIENSEPIPAPPLEPRPTNIECDLASFESLWVFTQFEKLMNGGLDAAFQPIVTSDESTVVGYEALARSSVGGLERPGLMFDAAEQLHQGISLSHLCRKVAVQASTGRTLPDQPLFLNTLPTEDLFRDVLVSLAELRKQAPSQQLVIEINGKAITDPSRMHAFIEEARALDVQVAYENFGAEEGRLRELLAVPADYMKFSSSFISGLSAASAGSISLIRHLVATARLAGTVTIAEGIEVRGTAKICSDLGFDLLQGYLYGPPTRDRLAE